MSDRHESWSRRQFAHGLALATTAGLGVRPALLAAESLPETKKLKLSVQRGSPGQKPHPRILDAAANSLISIGEAVREP
jgi:hypothetical protein